jgi:hypothetical protein
MREDERLSSGNLARLASLLNERAAQPEEVRHLLAEFVACVTAGEQPPGELLSCMRDVFAGYLSGAYKTLDRAFLVVRNRRGNPGADEVREFEIANAIMEHRMNNLSHEEALAEASAQFSCSTTKASTAWRRKREEVFYALRLMQSLSGNGLTADELQRAREIADVKPYNMLRIQNR